MHHTTGYPYAGITIVRETSWSRSVHAEGSLRRAEESRDGRTGAKGRGSAIRVADPSTMTANEDGVMPNTANRFRRVFPVMFNYAS